MATDDALVTDPAIYLLEAYRSSTGPEPGLAERLRAALGEAAGIRVLGLMEVPLDEAVLCLVAAETAAAVAAIQAIAGGYGSNARLLEVSWAPGGDPS
jgi:hypothetical protein